MENLYLQIAIPFITLVIGVVLDKAFEDRAKLTHFFVNPATTILKNDDKDDTVVNTHTVIVTNTGRKTANNVRLGHLFLPAFSIFPSCDYKVIELPDGKHEFLIPHIVKKEDYIINYLYFPPTLASNVNTYIKSDEGSSKLIYVQFTPIFSNVVKLAILGIFALGGISFIYLIVRLLVLLFTNS